MKRVWDLISKNREEAKTFLQSRENKEYVFAEYDPKAMEWVDPRYKGEDEDGKYVYAEDIAPFVTMSDDDGKVGEYIVKKIFIDDSGKFDILCVSMVATDNFSDAIIVPISYLYGTSEQFIFEMLMSLEGLEEV